MPRLRWDRTLETCVKRKMNALLTANQPPYWRSRFGLSAGVVPPLDPEDIISMWEEIAPTPESGRIETLPGCRSFRLIYGNDKFRVDALGEPTTHSLVLTRLPLDAPALLRRGFGWYRGWRDEGRQMDWDQLLGCAEQIDGDALVVPGCPPLVWSKLGLHAYGAPPIEDDEVCLMIDQITPPAEFCIYERGLIRFSIRLNQARDEFLAGIFGHPSPTLALLIRSGTYCEVCRQPATVHSAEVDDGKLSERHLCAAHAAQDELPPVTNHPDSPGSQPTN